MVKTLRVELKQQGATLQDTQAARDEAQASARVVGEERARMKAEWTDMFSAHDGLKCKIAEQAQQLAAADADLQVCAQIVYLRGRPSLCGYVSACWHSPLTYGSAGMTGMSMNLSYTVQRCVFEFGEEGAAVQRANEAMARLEHQVSVEKAVNRDLLQRKSDTEYQLMEALAQVPVSRTAPAASRQTQADHHRRTSSRLSTAHMRASQQGSASEAHRLGQSQRATPTADGSPELRSSSYCASLPAAQQARETCNGSVARDATSWDDGHLQQQMQGRNQHTRSSYSPTLPADSGRHHVAGTQAQLRGDTHVTSSGAAISKVHSTDGALAAHNVLEDDADTLAAAPWLAHSWRHEPAESLRDSSSRLPAQPAWRTTSDTHAAKANALASAAVSPVPSISSPGAIATHDGASLGASQVDTGQALHACLASAHDTVRESGMPCQSRAKDDQRAHERATERQHDLHEHSRQLKKLNVHRYVEDDDGATDGTSVVGAEWGMTGA